MSALICIPTIQAYENDHIISSTYIFSRPFLKIQQLVTPEIFYRRSIDTYKYAHSAPKQALGG